ncbi:protein S40-7-like [Solanum dulcamara]|uniref:protein S40-7-like n=1 Tax=Solanum dulcamara TaxID=45834 RepID=UPI0024851716|nr:protein S40-7-like [Solanum dulcamara]
MDSGGGGANNSRYQRKIPSSDRLLGIFSTAHSLSQPSTSTSASTPAAGDELSEHDIFDATSDAIHHSTPSTSTNPNANYHRSPNHRSHHKHFGILAALPESESHAQALLSVSSSSSSSSTSSARLIPIIPKRPPVDRVKYLQSAPVNVPVISAAAAGRRGRHFDDVDDDVDGGEMLPPHEFVASRKTPILASSVVEGAGRKLKGRDLRQVRDAIWQKTGFLT